MAGESTLKWDDFLADGGTAEEMELGRTDVLTFTGNDPERPERTYQETDSGIIWLRPSRDGPIPTPLTNFCAHIVGQVLEEVGLEEGQTGATNVVTRRVLKIRSLFRGEYKEFLVPSELFAAMEWVMDSLGSSAQIFILPNRREHAAAAIQSLSGDAPERYVYTRTGWRKMPDGNSVYVHGGGAIGARAVEGDSVRLTPALKPFVLPPPPEGKELHDAVLHSLSLVFLAPLHITLPGLAATYRSVLAASDLAIFFVGRTGVFKTQYAALLQAHFGSGFDATTLPANWSSTENALEWLAHAAKDALLVVDDYAPYGSSKAVQTMEAKAERLLRAQGNNSGRQRQTTELNVRPAMPPSGLILSTGEDSPRGHSIHARILTISLAPGDVDVALLSKCQMQARQGIFAQSMAGFLRWMAPQHETLSRELGEKVRSWSTHFIRPDQHTRAAYNAGHLMYGWSLFLDFAQEVGVLSPREKDDWIKKGINAIRKATSLHTQDQDATDPAIRFLEILRSALATNKAHLVSSTGSAPLNPEKWGWHFHDPGDEGKYTVWQPQGRKIGWIVEDDVYLDLVAATAVVNAHVDENDLRLTKKTMSKRLKEKGFLASTEPGRTTLLVRRTFGKHRYEVLHLKASLFGVEKPDQPDQNAELAPRPTDAPLGSPRAVQELRRESNEMEADQPGLFPKPKGKPSRGYGFH
jgi:hypothetical protein